MNSDHLLGLLEVYHDRVTLDDGDTIHKYSRRANKWLMSHAFITLAPTLCGYKVTERGLKTIQAALQYANQLVP